MKEVRLDQMKEFKIELKQMLLQDPRGAYFLQQDTVPAVKYLSELEDC